MLNRACQSGVLSPTQAAKANQIIQCLENKKKKKKSHLASDIIQ